MNDLLDLLDRATSDLPWEPDRLVTDAVTSGRARLRRGRVLATVSALAVAGCLGVGLTIASQGGTAGSRAVDPASSVAPAPKTKTTPRTQQPTEHWRLAVRAADVPTTFATLMGGTVTTVPNREMDDADPIIDFRWNGYAVRVGLTSDRYITGQPVPDPLTRCRELGSAGQPCLPGRAPGSYEQSGDRTGPAVDGGDRTAVVVVYFAQGWDVTVMESNAADFKDAPAISPELPLTLDQLRDAANSDVWFTKGNQTFTVTQ